MKRTSLGLALALTLCASARADRLCAAIVACQTPDGAITMGPGSEKVIPYFGNLAALGLVARGNLAPAEKWAHWYRKHMRADGTVNDHTGHSGAWKDTETRDSTDSYAATWLELVDALAVRDPSFRARLPFADVRRAVAAIRLTLQNDTGLTLAKPGYPVEYTMDNVEASRGLRAAARIARRAKSPAAREWDAMAARMEASIQTLLWDAPHNAYRVGIQPDGGRMDYTPDWYPGVMANLMAIGWQRPSARNKALFARLWAEFGKSVPAAARNEDDVEHLIWWAWAARGAGDSARLRLVLRRLEAVDPATVSIPNPSNIGHMCRLLGKR